MGNANALRLVNERGWRVGFANLFRAANAGWWRTRKWLIQTAIWLFFLNGMLAGMLWQIPVEKISEAAASFGNINSIEAMQQNLIAFALMMFLMVGSLAFPIAAVIAAQDAIIGERQSGTAAWVLSKPVSRPAFILSRLTASAIGMLVTGVVIQGAVAYLQLSLRIGSPWPVAGFSAAMGMVFLNYLFYLTLTTMLGSITRSRGPVLGISLAVALVGPTMLRGLLIIKEITPWTFFLNVAEELPTGLALALGQPAVSIIPIIGTAVMCLVFTAITILRFEREEF